MRPMLSFVATLVLVAPMAPAAETKQDQLPGTNPLTWTDDLSVRIVDGAHRFLDRKTEESVVGRAAFWRRDFSSPEAYEKSLRPNRERLQRILGAVDPRVAAVMERFGDEDHPALVAETGQYRVWQVRWTVVDGVHGEGLLLEPKAAVIAGVIALPDADQTPEQLIGLAPGIPAESQAARRLAENGFRVVVPTLVSRACDFSGNPMIRFTNQPHREWVYRQSFEMGRHVIGFEIQKVLAAVDWLERTAPGRPVGVMGYAEGGLIAFYAAALDPRIDACLVRGYFGSRQRLWEEPIYRNVFGLLREFGDAEIASLIAPRRLVVENCDVPRVDGPPAPTAGRAGGAAPGKLQTPTAESFEAERRRGRQLCGKFDPFGPDAADPMKTFAGALATKAGVGPVPAMALSNTLPQDARQKFDPQARQKRQSQELTDHVQRLQRLSDRVRDEFFLNKVYGKGPEAFVEGAKAFREKFYKEAIGAFDDPLLPPGAKSRKVYDTPKWTGYEVVLDVWPEVQAWGVLCVPKDLRAGERRPVVVCQHGLEGVPRDTIERDIEGFRYYKAFTAALAEQGFVTFAPYNLYRGQDRFRALQRKANPLGRSLFSIIIPQHQQILNWLGTLPFVDSSRIGFYGLSYGGKSAMRIPAVLEGYCLSICSGDFNDWVRKNASVDFPGSYMFTGEYEIFEWDLGGTFNYAEMSYLIYPRPFMVERGHHDGVGIDPWVAYEYAKTRWLYANLGRGDRTEIEFFLGPHEINGVGTYAFLRKHLRWPEK
jgi:dienelactone hydrolase